jgi:hypothetical protein
LIELLAAVLVESAADGPDERHHEPRLEVDVERRNLICRQVVLPLLLDVVDQVPLEQFEA